MPKIAQVLHRVPRAHQAVLFLLHVVTLLTGWPAEEASKGNRRYSVDYILHAALAESTDAKNRAWLFLCCPHATAYLLRLEVPAGQKNTINPHYVFKRILIVDHVGGCKTSRFK